MLKGLPTNFNLWNELLSLNWKPAEMTELHDGKCRIQWPFRYSWVTSGRTHTCWRLPWIPQGVFLITSETFFWNFKSLSHRFVWQSPPYQKKPWLINTLLNEPAPSVKLGFKSKLSWDQWCFIFRLIRLSQLPWCHVAHACLNNPSQWFTAAIQPRAGECSALFIFSVPVSQQETYRVRPLPCACTGLRGQ